MMTFENVTFHEYCVSDNCHIALLFRRLTRPPRLHWGQVSWSRIFCKSETSRQGRLLDCQSSIRDQVSLGACKHSGTHREDLINLYLTTPKKMSIWHLEFTYIIQKYYCKMLYLYFRVWEQISSHPYYQFRVYHKSLCHVSHENNTKNN